MGYNSWVSQSIMNRRGIAAGKTGKTHTLTEEQQAEFHFTIGPYSKTVLTVNPGDRIVVDTRDAFSGRIKTEADKPSEKIRLPFANPQNGPIVIEGAAPGDALAVHIEEMLPRGEQPRGTCALIPEFGALTGTYYTATLNQPLPEIVRKILVDEKTVHWSDKVKLPYKPHIGTLSCSPEIDSISSLTPDNHGGNMDLPDMGPGTVTCRFACRAPACSSATPMPARATAKSAAWPSSTPARRRSASTSSRAGPSSGRGSRRRISSWPSAARGRWKTPPASPIAS